MSDPVLVGAFAAATAFEVWLFRCGPSSPLSRRSLRLTYTNAALPMAVRAWAGVVPVWIVITGLAAVIALVGPPLGLWLSAPLIVAICLALILSYQAPPVFLPQFLREEIAQGVIELQRPTFFDWLLLAFVLGLFVVGAALLLLVNLGFG